MIMEDNPNVPAIADNSVGLDNAVYMRLEFRYSEAYILPWSDGVAMLNLLKNAVKDHGEHTTGKRLTHLDSIQVSVMTQQTMNELHIKELLES